MRYYNHSVKRYLVLAVAPLTNSAVGTSDDTLFPNCVPTIVDGSNVKYSNSPIIMITIH
jgi:hypothetical protein